MKAPDALAADFLAAERVRGLNDATLAILRIALSQFVAWLKKRRITDLRHVTHADLERYRSFLAARLYKRSHAPDVKPKPLAAKTQYEKLLAPMRWLSWLARRRVLPFDPGVRLVVAPVVRQLPETVLSEGEVAKLLNEPDTTEPLGLRDRAILELLYSTGLRRAEIAALDAEDIDLTGGTVFVRQGKGGRPRLVPLGESAVEILLDYLTRARPQLASKRSATALFLSSSRCGSKGQRLGPQALADVVKKNAERAGLSRPVTPHALRHSLATHLVRAGADVRHVQEILGHADITTTEIYTQLAAADVAEAQARSHPRGRAPKTPTPRARLSGRVWSSSTGRKWRGPDKPNAPKPPAKRKRGRPA